MDGALFQDFVFLSGQVAELKTSTTTICQMGMSDESSVSSSFLLLLFHAIWKICTSDPVKLRNSHKIGSQNGVFQDHAS